MGLVGSEFAIPQQTDYFFTMTGLEAKWGVAKHVILGDEPPLRLFAEAVIWQKKIETFRKGEDERMFMQEPTPEDLAVHKSLLQRLIVDGEHLVSLVAQIGLPENVEGISRGSLAATVEMLRAEYRGWHEPMPSEKREQILRQVFPDVT
ncbi:hypothetical protein SBV1_1160015 [Verrucomicrobia bacterium]|nr:hypothetical protein SBV1_1160015 [Verrucomicrobiota bacterium]